MKRYVTIAALALFAGCLSPAPKAPVAWNIDVDTGLKVSTVAVNAPYDGTRFVVLRGDGSVAFDAYNVFSSRPVSLVRAAVVLDPDGPELVVRRMALDCRKEGERRALVELQLRASSGVSLRAEASSSAEDGDYTKAFSSAFASAVGKLVSGKRR